MASLRETTKKAPVQGLRWAEKSRIRDFYPKYRIFQLGKKNPATLTGRKIFISWRGGFFLRRRAFS